MKKEENLQNRYPVIKRSTALIIAVIFLAAANPQNAGAWARLGHAYFDSNKFEKAIHAYKKHLGLNPGNADVWTDLGVMYRRSGKPGEALRLFNKAIEINPRKRLSGPGKNW